MKTAVIVIVLTVLNFALGLPPARRYGFNDNGYRTSAGSGGFGPRFGVGGRGLADHANWSPMRAREAMRPLQRLPPLSRTQGPGYFNYAQDDDEPSTRYGRSQRSGSNIGPINDFSDVDNTDMDDEGVNVGGVLWPRRLTSKTESTTEKFDDENTNHEGGCSHYKAATFAKDATAAAANAATSAAAAARAAARAAAVAACNPNGALDDIQDDTESEESEDENSAEPLGYRVVYPSSIRENVYQGEEMNSQDTVGSEVNFHGSTGVGEYQDTITGSRVNSQDNKDTEMYSEDTNCREDSPGSGDRRLYSQDTTSNGVNSQGSGTELYSRDTFSNGITSQDIGTLYSRDTTNNGVNSQGSGLYSRGTSNGVNSQGGGSGLYSWDTTNNRVNSQGSSDGLYSISTASSGVNSLGSDSGLYSQRNASKGVNSISNSGQFPQGTASSVVYSQGTKGAGRAAHSKGTSDSGANSQGSGVNSQAATSNGLNSKDDKVPELGDTMDEAKKNFTSTNSKIQKILSKDDQKLIVHS